MKVKFIDKNIKGLTYQKEYEVKDNGVDHYQITDDNGEDMYHPKRFFSKVFENKGEYNMINPTHYKGFDIETIDMMIDIWGKENVRNHCQMCAFKYRMRLGNKPGQPLEQEMDKIRWYESKANELSDEQTKEKA